ncbi:MAG TPA: sigma-70 family RNA polymerase sigma factor [Vicinamibacterales bacterium]|nr:sigma-70 family RNA polymerase sigma factor [Vicinamibacterales bacterium]
MADLRDITQLLQDWNDGDERALDQLTPLLYSELRRIAHRSLRRERSDHTLQTTALVNETFVRLVQWSGVRWQNRAQFLAVSAQLMRRILVDFARSRRSGKRGGGTMVAVALDEGSTAAPDRAREIVALDDALRRLSLVDPRKSRIVELRFFGGLTLDETAAVLKVSSRTILREWDLAKAWLRREMDAQE